MRFSTDRFVLLICLMASCHSYALEILEDESLSDTSGEGISLLPENFNITFDALSYMRAIPRGVPSGALKHADIYWYGISLGTSDGSVSALSNLNSLSVGKVSSWGSATNPWVLRVESTTNIHYDGSTGLYPIFQYRAPTYTPGEGGLKYAFVGDLQVCNNPNAVPIGANGTGVCGGGTLIAGTLADGASAGHLEMLNVWNDVTLNGSRVSIFQNTYDNSFGLTWLNRINSSPTGVYRLGVAQTGAIGTVGGGFETIAPTFDLGSPTDPADKGEGVYFTDLDINLPWGNLHYQPIIFSSDATGNFAVELVRIPNQAAVYNAAYRDYSNSVADNAKQCNNTTINCGGDLTTAPATHGQLSIGNVSFKGVSSNTTVNLGSASLDGVFFHHLKIKTLGL